MAASNEDLIPQVRSNSQCRWAASVQLNSAVLSAQHGSIWSKILLLESHRKQSRKRCHLVSSLPFLQRGSNFVFLKVYNFL